jgi:purine-nucleoside phosphorylase
LFGVAAGVPGHEGKLVVARLGDRQVAFMAGRFHMYEGYTAEEVTRPIQVAAELGVKQLVVTAAGGALHEKYRVGDFVLLSDVLTLFLALQNPLIGPKFQDMSEAFDPAWRAVARQILVKHEIGFHEGVYSYYHGPNYESPADKMALKFLGGDLAGMSVVPELLMAKYLGMKVLGLGFVTNLAFVKHDHHEVVAQAEAASAKMVTLLSELIQQTPVAK